MLPNQKDASDVNNSVSRRSEERHDLLLLLTLQYILLIQNGSCLLIFQPCCEVERKFLLDVTLLYPSVTNYTSDTVPVVGSGALTWCVPVSSEPVRAAHLSSRLPLLVKNIKSLISAGGIQAGRCLKIATAQIKNRKRLQR